MKIKNQAIAGLAVLGSVWGLLSAACFFKSPTETSVSERRKLASFPKTNAETLLSYGADFTIEVKGTNGSLPAAFFG